MAGEVSSVLVTLLADTKEFSAKIDEAGAKMRTLGAEAETSSGKFAGFASKASTAVLGVGIALGGYALDKAYKFQEALDQIRNQSGASAAEVNRLGKSILNISGATGVTTTDLTQAGLAVEQAGIRGAKAQQLLNNASKASVITGTNVVDVTKAIISAQTLQVAKGMSVANMTGLLVAGAKDTIGGLSQESNLLQGRVGVALAAVGLKMKDIIAAGAEFSHVGLNSRATVSFATGLAKLQLPLDTVHVTAKKTYTTLSTYALSLKAVGLSQAQLASSLRMGGVAGLLKDIKDAAAATHQPLQQLLQVIFGSGGAGTASVLTKNLGQFLNVTKQISGAGAGSLASGFKNAVKQLGPQFKILMAQVDRLMITAGDKLLPAAGKLASWANDFFTYLKNNPGVASLGVKIAGAIFTGAAVAKFAGWGIAIANSFGFAVKAGVATAIGSAIGVALLAVIAAGTGKQLTTGVKQVAQGSPGAGFTNILGGLDNTLKNLTNDLTSPLGFKLGSIIQPQNYKTVGTKKSTVKVTSTHRVKFVG